MGGGEDMTLHTSKQAPACLLPSRVTHHIVMELHNVGVCEFLERGRKTDSVSKVSCESV